MTASVNRPEDIVNLALARIGYPMRVENMREGSRAARAALLVYANARDALLREGDWGFAQTTIAAVASGQAAPTPWAVSYQYPADCLRVRNLIAAAFDANDPLPVLWEIAANSTVGRVILTNQANAQLVYTAQVTDPARFEPLFVEAFADALGRELVPALASAEAGKITADALKTALPVAEGTVG